VGFEVVGGPTAAGKRDGLVLGPSPPVLVNTPHLLKRGSRANNKKKHNGSWERVGSSQWVRGIDGNQGVKEKYK